MHMRMYCSPVIATAAGGGYRATEQAIMAMYGTAHACALADRGWVYKTARRGTNRRLIRIDPVLTTLFVYHLSSMSLPTRKIGTDNVSSIGFGAMGISIGYGKADADEERYKVCGWLQCMSVVSV